MAQIKKNKIFFVGFGVLWLGLILWNLLTPVQEFSQAENRSLAAFPKFTVSTLLNGKYMDDVNTFLNDQFAGRAYWVSGQTLVEYGLGKREVNSVYLGKKALLGALPPEDAAMSPENVRGVNDFAQQYGMPTYVMLVPSAAVVQPEKLPPFAGSWNEEEYINRVYAEFSQEVTTVPVLETLRAHKDEYIYYRTDHHWTSYGAFLANTSLQEAMGRAAPKQSDFSPQAVSGGFMGTFHSKTGFPLVEPDSMELYQRGRVVRYDVFDGKETLTRDSAFYDEYLEKKDKYTYFLGPVQPVSTVYTASDSGKKLLVFKDSYAHCFVPMLLEEYSEIRLVDLRYLNATDYKEALEIDRYDETLFLYSADVFAHQKGPYKLQAKK